MFWAVIVPTMAPLSTTPMLPGWRDMASRMSTSGVVGLAVAVTPAAVSVRLTPWLHHVERRQHGDRVHVLDEIGHILVGRVLDDILRRAALDDAAAFHDGDAVADAEGLVEIVADEQDGLLQAALEFQQFVLQPGADQRIERRERLVHQQDRRAGGKGAGETDALLHAARKLLDLAAGPFGQIDEFQLLVDALLALRVRHAGQFQPEADIVGNRAPGQQRELLEHHRDGVHAEFAQRLGRRSCRD